MITYRKPDESRSDYFKREYSLCMARVDKYYVLQSLRRSQGYFGAALFYQHEAARWHDRAMQSRRNWVISGTHVARWQDANRMDHRLREPTRDELLQPYSVRYGNGMR